MKWAKKHARCINCGTTEYGHYAKGLCITCYRYERWRKYKESKNGKISIKKSILKNKLKSRQKTLENRFFKFKKYKDIKELRLKGLTYQEIGKKYNLSRQRIQQICKYY